MAVDLALAEIEKALLACRQELQWLVKARLDGMSVEIYATRLKQLKEITEKVKYLRECKMYDDEHRK